MPLPGALHHSAVELWHECGLTRPWNDPEQDLVRALAGPSSTVLAALAGNGGLVGTAMVGVDGHRGWVYYLAVSPAHRGRGTGRLLMGAAERWLLAHGAPKAQLMARGGNDDALAFYARLGYEVADVVVLGRRLDG